MRHLPLRLLLSPLALAVASCGAPATGESRPEASTQDAPFTLAEAARFDEPWAIAFLPDGAALVTERAGKLKLWRAGTTSREVAGVPRVDYGGQGGLGDVALAPDFASSGMIYLSWVEAGSGDNRGAVVGRAKLVMGNAPRLENMQVIWRQEPKVSGRGHFSHRITFSPDGRYLYVSSGERQKFTPAQDLGTNLGKVLRLLPDGTPAPGNPFAARGGIATQVWTLGHRNLLGLEFDAQGRLWDLEHGPRGGDELNLLKPGQNYGWPIVSNGDHYDGRKIPRHATRPDFAAPAISWNPVIAPGGFTFVRGGNFPDWQGQALIGGMGPPSLVRVAIDGERAREVARYPMDTRIRAVEQGTDGTIWLLEDGSGGRLLRLVPRAR
jgi:glucose/arabinose dehydrogenase